MTGLVLSGGGAKGSYEVGVVKALEKLGYKFDVVCGTSIGSVNAVLYTQGGYKLMNKFWHSAKVKDLFDIENINELAEADSNKARLKVVSEVIKRGGLETNAFYKKVKDILDEDKIKKSNKKLGIMTFNVSEMKGEEIYFDTCPKGKFSEYILASCSCFPILKGTTIDDEFYIDGGFSDNMPIEMACKLGARKIVSVDLKAPGVKKIIKDKYKGEDIKVTTIFSDESLGDMIVFTKKEIDSNINLGYNDTMKAFNKAYGKEIIISDKTLNKIIIKINNLNLNSNININLKSIEKEIEDIKQNPEKFILENLEEIYSDIKEKINKDNKDNIGNKFITKYTKRILNYDDLKRLVYLKYIFRKKNLFKEYEDTLNNDIKNIKDIKDINKLSDDLKDASKNYKSVLLNYIYNLIYNVTSNKDKDRDTKLKVLSIFMKKELRLAIFINLMMQI